MSTNKLTPVVVTGFGPFGKHTVNISWEVAEALSKLSFQSHGIDLKAYELPVVYGSVLEVIPSLWQKHNPALVVHMGLSSLGSEIALETIAHRKGYAKMDEEGKVPDLGCVPQGQDILRTCLHVEDVCDRINNSCELKVPVCISSNAGRYVCEFSFYISLNIDCTRTAFIHLPNFDEGYTVKELADVVKQIIIYLLEKVPKSEGG